MRCIYSLIHLLRTAMNLYFLTCQFSTVWLQILNAHCPNTHLCTVIFWRPETMPEWWKLRSKFWPNLSHDGSFRQDLNTKALQDLYTLWLNVTYVTLNVSPMPPSSSNVEYSSTDQWKVQGYTYSKLLYTWLRLHVPSFFARKAVVNSRIIHESLASSFCKLHSWKDWSLSIIFANHLALKSDMIKGYVDHYLSDFFGAENVVRWRENMGVWRIYGVRGRCKIL